LKPCKEKIPRKDLHKEYLLIVHSSENSHLKTTLLQEDGELNYRLLFKHMLNGFAYCKMLFDEKGKPYDFVYLDVNSSFEKLTGLHGVVGKRITEVIPDIKKEHPEIIELYGRVAKTGRPEQLELFFNPLSIWLSLSVYCPRPDHFAVVFDNITEKKNAAEKYRQLVENLSDVIFTISPQGKLLYISPICKEFGGYDPVEEQGELFTKYLVKKEDKERGMQLLNELMKTKKSATIVSLYQPKNKEPFYVEVAARPLIREGKVIAIQCVVRDIHARIMLQEQYLKEKEWMNSLVTLAPNIVVGLGEQSRIVLFNKFAEKLTGYTAQEVIGKKWIELFIPEKLQTELYHIWDTLVKTNMTEFHHENLILLKNGKERLISWNSMVLPEDGKFKMVLAIGDDITDRKTAEADLISRTQELEKFNRIFIDREMKMIELKKKIKELEAHPHHSN
jgi:PAS domain S-box-containing protein